MHSLFVMIGGGIGALCRMIITELSQRYVNIRMPIGTLIANLFGACLIGFISGIILQHQWLNVFLITGFLGGLTTFSTLQLELVQLIKQKQYALVLTYMLLQYVGCFGCCYIAYSL